jgi:hypothetical protein
MNFMRVFLFASLFSTLAFGQYKAEPAGPPPAEAAPSISADLQKDGTKITNNGKPYLEIWLRADKPPAGKPDEGQTLSVAQGALLGVIRFDTKGQDRRGQGIQPGVYTLRYSLIPVNGDHQGAAPQRDFVLMVPAANDKDLNAAPAFDALVDMSKKASGTPHPAVLSLYKADSDFAPGFAKQGDTDWVLQTKLGDVPIGITLIGIAGS